MITAEPDITRLLGRLKAQKLVRQQRDKRDKRVLWTQISPAGLALLAEMDPVVQQAPKDLLGHLAHEDLAQLIRLVEAARSRCGDRQAPVSCDGANGNAGESCQTDHSPAISE
jgi:DNA-binding MarR family transcriptional regulator